MRGGRQDSARLLPAEVPFLNAYVARQSFSEIRNARAALEELGARYVMAVETWRQMDRAQSAGSGWLAPSCRERHLDLAIQELEHGMEDFRGTGQEFVVARDLLRALKKSGRYDRWLEVYLDILYRHPTQPLIGVLTRDAMRAAKGAGREDVLVAGFRHLTTIPFEFETKVAVQRALAVTERPEQQPAEALHPEHASCVP